MRRELVLLYSDDVRREGPCVTLLLISMRLWGILGDTCSFQILGGEEEKWVRWSKEDHLNLIEGKMERKKRGGIGILPTKGWGCGIGLVMRMRNMRIMRICGICGCGCGLKISSTYSTYRGKKLVSWFCFLSWKIWICSELGVNQNVTHYILSPLAVKLDYK